MQCYDMEYAPSCLKARVRERERDPKGQSEGPRFSRVRATDGAMIRSDLDLFDTFLSGTR